MTLSAPEINLNEWTQEELVDGVRTIRVQAVQMEQGNFLPKEYDGLGSIYFKILSEGQYRGKIIVFQIKRWNPMYIVPYYVNIKTGDIGEQASIKYVNLIIAAEATGLTAFLDMIEKKSLADRVKP